MRMNKHFRVYLPKIIGGLIFVLAIGYLIKIISNFISEPPVKHGKKIQPVTLFKPPPPPPPPPKTEPPPEPEKVEPLDEPEAEPEPLPDVPDEQPAGDTGLDAEGTAGSDAFGLVGRKGGRGLLGGGGGSPSAIYAGTVKREFNDFMSEESDLRKKNWSAVLNIWMNPDGTVLRFKLMKSSSDPEIDKLITKRLAKFRSHESAPGSMNLAEPIILRPSVRL